MESTELSVETNDGSKNSSEMLADAETEMDTEEASEKTELQRQPTKLRVSVIINCYE